MALAVVVSLFASYFVAMTVVPLFCARYLKLDHPEHLSEAEPAEARTLKDIRRLGSALQRSLQCRISSNAGRVRSAGPASPSRPGNRAGAVLPGLCRESVCSTISLGFPTSRRPMRVSLSSPLRRLREPSLPSTEKEAASIESLIKEIVRPEDLGIIVDNIGVDNGFSAVYTSNAAMHTGFIQVGLQPGASHRQL